MRVVHKEGNVMVEKQTWFFMSYVSAFFSIYLLSIAYPVILTVFKAPAIPVEQSYVYSANATMVGLTGMNNMSSWFPTLALIIISVVIIGFIISYFSMGRAME